MIDWDFNVEEILTQTRRLLSDRYKDTEYYFERNSTAGEKNIDVFKNGYPKRIGYIYPKKRFQQYDLCLEIGLFNIANSKMILPELQEIKINRYSNTRRCRVETEKMLEILDAVIK
ncbi:MAG: hypothetical protein MJ172_11500 [Clostridia bacterium]|nr:hypothetical protein [Clostridia bacterium]